SFHSHLRISPPPVVLICDSTGDYLSQQRPLPLQMQTLTATAPQRHSATAPAWTARGSHPASRLGCARASSRRRLVAWNSCDTLPVGYTGSRGGGAARQRRSVGIHDR